MLSAYEKLLAVKFKLFYIYYFIEVCYHIEIHQRILIFNVLVFTKIQKSMFIVTLKLLNSRQRTREKKDTSPASSIIVDWLNLEQECVLLHTTLVLLSHKEYSRSTVLYMQCGYLLKKMEAAFMMRQSAIFTRAIALLDTEEGRS